MTYIFVMRAKLTRPVACAQLLTTRSRPTPHPPCGGAPTRNESTYALMLSTSTPQAVARSVRYKNDWFHEGVFACFKNNDSEASLFLNSSLPTSY